MVKRYSLHLLMLLLAACSLLTACVSNEKEGQTFRLTRNGLMVDFAQSQSRTSGWQGSLCLQVVDDHIIRVMASPDGNIAQQAGPMCAHGKKFSKKALKTFRPDRHRGETWNVQGKGFQVQWQADTLSLQTSAMCAKLCTRDGVLAFFDAGGNVLLQEPQDGRRFEYVGKYGTEDIYCVQQLFLSPEDEAFYGLGQHQSGEMNYKNKHERLYQYNTKVSVPFVVSNRHYGLLWDNYSYSKWGDPREFEPLTTFTLYDKYRQPGALTASYINRSNPEDVFERRESRICYEDLESIKNFPEKLNLSKCNVEWEGYLQAPADGDFRFLLYYAGYVRVFVDDKEVVAERWRTAWNPNYYKFEYPMQADKLHHLKIEWRPGGGSSYLALRSLNTLPEYEGKISFWSEMASQADYYVVAGETADEVLAGYRRLTGKAQVMPRWAMGFWQSRERYKTQKELLDVLSEFRQREIPVDNIVQDWSYWPEDQWGSHEFEASRYPDPQAMVDQVHAQNARLMISVWPKFYHNTQHYKELDAIGGMYHRAVDDSIKDWIGKGYVGSFYDVFNPKARELFWEQMSEHLYSLGVDAWWMDASEPDILSNADMDYRKALMSPTAAGPAEKWFNAYGLLNAQGIYEGQRSENPDERVFLLTRSGYAGSQRYGAVIWSGDIGTRWEDMAAQITAGLNYSISGNPYWTMDNGGFCVERRYEKAKEGSADREEWRELNVRWHQFGAFVPIFRSHGQYPYRELWNIAPESHPAYAAMKYYTELRYRLMPYLYSMAGWCHFKDYTMMRPLMMDFPDDRQVLDIADQYMFGPSLMVAPVCAYRARSREVYFPAGRDWYDFYTGRCYAGGQWAEVPAPYDRMPLFVPSGSVIPMGELVQHTATPQTSLKLLVYPGADASFSLYEDDGLHYDYEKGLYSQVDVLYNDSASVLAVGQREGKYTAAPRYDIKVFLMGDGKGFDWLLEAGLLDGEIAGVEASVSEALEDALPYDGSALLIGLQQ